MASTKTATAIADGVTMTAGAGDVTHTAVNLDDGYGAALHVKLTNGGTGPTVAARVQVEVSADNSEWYDLGHPLIGNTDNSGVASWGGIAIPMGVEHLRLVSGSNTSQNVTLDADISEVTAL